MSWHEDTKWLCETHHHIVPEWPGKEPKACASFHWLEDLHRYVSMGPKPLPCRFVWVEIRYLTDPPAEEEA